MKRLVLCFIYINIAFGFAQNSNHSQWTILLQKHVSDNGNVHYKNFQKDRSSLDKYLTFLTQNSPKTSWSKNEHLAFWINAYNALTIKLILSEYPLKSIKDVKRPWSRTMIEIDGKKLSLDDIEHKILRQMEEVRIHFAIVCASKSCPKLQNTAYEATHLDAMLDAAAKDFINDQSKNIITRKVVNLSKIFRWFSVDFPKHTALFKFINRYSTTKVDSNAKINYLTYDWALNE